MNNPKKIAWKKHLAKLLVTGNWQHVPTDVLDATFHFIRTLNLDVVTVPVCGRAQGSLGRASVGKKMRTLAHSAMAIIMSMDISPERPRNIGDAVPK